MKKLKNRLLHRVVSIGILCLFVLNPILSQAEAIRGMTAAELSPPSAFSAKIPRVTELSNGTFAFSIPKAAKHLVTYKQVDKKYEADKGKARRFTFIFLSYIVGKALRRGVFEDDIRSIILTILGDEPMRLVIQDYFHIYNIYKDGNALVIPFKKRPGQAVRYCLNYEDLIGRGEKVSGDTGEVVYFEFVNINLDNLELTTERSLTIEDLSEAIDGKDFEGQLEQPKSKENGKDDNREEDFKKRHNAYEAEYRAFRKRVIQSLIDKGGEVSYMYTDLSRWLIDADVAEWTPTEEGFMDVPIEKRLRVPQISIKSQAKDLFPNLKVTYGGNNRDVYANDEVVLKTSHGYSRQPGSFTSLLEEYKMHRKKYGQMAFSRPVAIVNNSWLIEERGYDCEEEIREAIKNLQFDKARKIVMQSAMLMRFFYEINHIPDQFDAMLSRDGKRIFLIDEGPHQYSLSQEKKDTNLRVIRQTITGWMKNTVSAEALENVERDVREWFDEGFYHPEQFEQYQMMMYLYRKGEEDKIKLFVDLVRPELSRIWNNIFTEEVCGSLDDFIDEYIKPVGKSMRRFGILSKENSGFGMSPRSLVLYVDSLTETVFLDFDTAFKRMRMALSKDSVIVLYVNRARNEQRAQVLKGMINKAIPEVRVTIVERKDIYGERGEVSEKGIDELDDLIKYLNRTNTYRTVGKNEPKKILGIMLSNRDIDWAKFFKKYDYEAPCVVMNSSAQGLFSLTKAFTLMLAVYEEKVLGNNDPHNPRKWIRLFSPIPMTGKIYKQYLKYKEQVFTMA